MSQRRSKKKEGNSLSSEPIMTEVFDGSGNKPLPTSLERLKAKKAAKSGNPLPGTKDFNDLVRNECMAASRNFRVTRLSQIHASAHVCSCRSRNSITVT